MRKIPSEMLVFEATSFYLNTFTPLTRGKSVFIRACSLFIRA
ncbi:hypothetical protein [Planomicrobium sp. MB-3u-38]|nr:hypothetical protein [Planomicrobium sp. MB-3u-38]